MMATLPRPQSRGLPRQASAPNNNNRSLSPLPRVKRGHSNRNVSPTNQGNGMNNTKINRPISPTRSQSTSRLPPRANSVGSGNTPQRVGRRSTGGGTGGGTSGGGGNGGLPARINSYGGPSSRKSFANINKNNNRKPFNHNNNNKPKLLVDYSKRRADLNGKKFVSQSDRALNIRKTFSLEEEEPSHRRHHNKPKHSMISRAQSERNHHSTSAVVDWHKLSNELEWEEEQKQQQQSQQQQREDDDRHNHSSCTDFLRQSFLTKPLGMSNSHLSGADFHFQKEGPAESPEQQPQQQEQKRQGSNESINNASTRSIIVETPDDDPDLLGGSSHHTITLRSSRRESMNLKKKHGLLLDPRSRSLSPVRSKSDATGSPVVGNARKMLKKTASLSPIRRPSSIKRNVSGGPPPFNHLGLQPTAAGSGHNAINNASFRKKKPNIIQRIVSGGPPPLNHMGLASFRQQPQQQQQQPQQQPQVKPQQKHRPLQRSKTSPVRTRPTMERMTVTGKAPPTSFIQQQRQQQQQQQQQALGKKSSKSLMDDDSSNKNMNSSKGSGGAMEDESMRLGDVFGVDNSNFSGSYPCPSSTTRRGPPTTTTGTGGAARQQHKWVSMGQQKSSGEATAGAATTLQKKDSRDSTDDETDELIKKLTQDAGTVPPPPVMGLRLYKSMSAMTMSAFAPKPSTAAVTTPFPPSNNSQNPPPPTPYSPNNSLKKESNEQMDDFSGASQDTHGSLSFRRKSGSSSSKRPTDNITSIAIATTTSPSSSGGRGASKKKNLHLGGTLGNLQPWDDDFNDSLSSMSSHWESMDDDSYQQEQDRRRRTSQVAVVSGGGAAASKNKNNKNNRKSSLALGDDDDSEAEAKDNEEDLLFLPAPPTVPPKRSASAQIMSTSSGKDKDVAGGLRGSTNKKDGTGPRSLKGSRDEEMKVPDIARPPTSLPRRAASSGTLGESNTSGGGGGGGGKSRRRNSNTRSKRRNSVDSSSRPNHRRSLSDSGPVVMSNNSSLRMNGSSSGLWGSRRRRSLSLGDSDPSMKFVLRRKDSRQDNKLHDSISSVGDSQQQQCHHQSDSNLFGADEDFMDFSERKRRLRDKLVRSNSSFRKNEKEHKQQQQQQHHDDSRNQNISTSRSNTPSPTNSGGNRTNPPSHNRKQFQKTLSVTRLESEYERFQRTIVTEHLKAKKEAEAKSAAPNRRNAALLMKSDSVPKNLGQKRPKVVKANSSSQLFSSNRKDLHHSNNTEKNSRRLPHKAASSSDVVTTSLQKANEVLAAVGSKASTALTQMGAPRRAALPPTTWTRNRSGRDMQKQGSSRRGGLEKERSSRRNISSERRNVTRSTSPVRRQHPVSNKSLGRSKSLDEDGWEENKAKAKGFRESMMRQASFLTGSRIRRLNNPNFNNSVSNLNASFSPSHSQKKGGYGNSMSNLHYSVPDFKY